MSDAKQSEDGSDSNADIVSAGGVASNMQQRFLMAVMDAKVGVTIYLTNGVKLQGMLASYDDLCVLLVRREHPQLVYKHAISTILPDETLTVS